MTLTAASSPESTDTKVGDHSKWGEISVQMCVVAIGLLTAMCYALGRARLLGWHEAAGLPLLTFSWPFQDVLLTGFLSVEHWFYVAATAISALILIAVQLIATEKMELLSKRFSDRRSKGERCDQICLRQRFAIRARQARLGKMGLNPVQERLRHLALGIRGNSKKLSNLGERKQNAITGTLRSAAMLILGALALCLVALVYFISVWFIARAYHEGEARFLDEYYTATGSIPYLYLHGGQIKEVNSEPKKQPIATRLTKTPTVVLLRYAYVRVVPNMNLKAAAEGGELCGWLIQSSQNQVLLLTKKGLQMLAFGDQPFALTQVAPEECPKIKSK